MHFFWCCDCPDTAQSIHTSKCPACRVQRDRTDRQGRECTLTYCPRPMSSELMGALRRSSLENVLKPLFILTGQQVPDTKNKTKAWFLRQLEAYVRNRNEARARVLTFIPLGVGDGFEMMVGIGDFPEEIPPPAPLLSGPVLWTNNRGAVPEQLFCFACAEELTCWHRRPWLLTCGHSICEPCFTALKGCSLCPVSYCVMGVPNEVLLQQVEARCDDIRDNALWRTRDARREFQGGQDVRAFVALDWVLFHVAQLRPHYPDGRRLDEMQFSALSWPIDLLRRTGLPCNASHLGSCLGFPVDPYRYRVALWQIELDVFSSMDALEQRMDKLEASVPKLMVAGHLKFKSGDYPAALALFSQAWVLDKTKAHAETKTQAETETETHEGEALWCMLKMYVCLLYGGSDGGSDQTWACVPQELWTAWSALYGALRMRVGESGCSLALGWTSYLMACAYAGIGRCDEARRLITLALEIASKWQNEMSKIAFRSKELSFALSSNMTPCWRANAEYLSRFLHTGQHTGAGNKQKTNDVPTARVLEL